MSISDRKLEIAIVVVSVILVGGLGNLLKSPVQSALGLQDISYEMPRPKASLFASLFELGDRSISRKYINPFKDKAAAAKKSEADAKKQEEAKKTVAQAKKAAQKKAAANKKPKVEVEVYGDDTHVALNDNPAFSADGFDAGAGGQNPNYDGKKATEKTTEKDDKDKLSVDQWRALILAQPTDKNVGKMVAAFLAEDLSADGFYGIVAELYKDRRPEVQALGLMAAKASYNASAFSVTAQYIDSLNTNVQADAHKYLLSYGASGRLGVLASALKSSTPEVVELAAEVVIAAYQNNSTGNNPGYGIDPRSQRGDKNSAPSNFAQFVPIFKELANSTDPEISGLAQTALSQMGSLVASL